MVSNGVHKHGRRELHTKTNGVLRVPITGPTTVGSSLAKFTKRPEKADQMAVNGDGNRKSPPPLVVGLLVGTYMRALCLFLRGSGPCLYKWDTHIVFWIIYTHHQFSATETAL